MRKEETRAQGLGIALLGTFTAFSLGDNRLGAISAVTFFAPVLKSFELVAAASARRRGIILDFYTYRSSWETSV